MIKINIILLCPFKDIPVANAVCVSLKGCNKIINVQWLERVICVGITHHLKSFEWQPMTYQHPCIPSRLSVWTLSGASGISVNSSSTSTHLTQKNRYVCSVAELIHFPAKSRVAHYSVNSVFLLISVSSCSVINDSTKVT